MKDFSEIIGLGYWHISFFEKDDKVHCVISSKDVKQVSLFGHGANPTEAYRMAVGSAAPGRRRDVEDLA